MVHNLNISLKSAFHMMFLVDLPNNRWSSFFSFKLFMFFDNKASSLMGAWMMVVGFSRFMVFDRICSKFYLKN